MPAAVPARALVFPPFPSFPLHFFLEFPYIEKLGILKIDSDILTMYFFQSVHKEQQ
jgi:hypothetical protein